MFTCFLCGKVVFSASVDNRPDPDPHRQRPAIGTRGLGLSRAYISSVDDATSPLWNSAGLASLNAGHLIYDFSQGAFSAAYPIKHIGTFGINILDLNSSDRFLVHHTSNPIGTFEYGANQALLSYARKFGLLQLGASTGYSRAPHTNSLWTPNYDVGALITLSPAVTVGMQARDISGVSIQDDHGTVLQTYNPQFAIGTTLTPYPLIRWHSCVNVTDLSFGTSVEFVSGSLSANIGSFFSFDTDTPAQSWSLGLSFSKWGKQTYYTFLNEGNQEYKHLLAFGLTFGQTEKAKPFITDATSKKTPHILETPREPEDRRDIDPDARSNRVSPAETPSTSERTTPKNTKKTSVQIANKYNISVELMLAIIYVESKFNSVAVSKTGAGGLMQMVPATARELGLKVPMYTNKLKPSFDATVDERFDARMNLEAGLIYLNQLLERYQQDLTLALGAYNVGPGRVRVSGPLISRGRIYVNKVLGRQKRYRDDPKLLATDLNRLEIILNK